MTSDNDPFTAQPGVFQPGLIPGAAVPPPPAAPGAPGAPSGFIPPAPPTSSAAGLSTAAIILTGAYTALSVVGALLVRSAVETLKDTLADGSNSQSGLGVNAISSLGSLVGIAAFVFLALWMARIRSNLKAVGRTAGGPPAVEWWGWFVPLANFVLPLLGMRAISRRSVGWGLLLGWWIPFCAVWVLQGVSSTATFRALDLGTGELTHPEALDSMVPFTYASTGALVLSWLFLVIIIRRTTARHLDA